MPCPRCGTELPPRSKFCLSCGMPQPSQEPASAPAPAARPPAGSRESNSTPRAGQEPPWTRTLVNAAPSTPLEPTLSQEQPERLPTRFARKQATWVPALVVGLCALALVGGFAAVWAIGQLNRRSAAPLVAVVSGGAESQPSAVVAPPSPATPGPNPVASPPGRVPSYSGPSVVVSPPGEALPGAPVLAPNQLQGAPSPVVVPPPVVSLPEPRPSNEVPLPPERPRPVMGPPMQQPRPAPAAPVPPPVEDIRPYLAWLKQMEYYRRWVSGNAIGLRLEMPARDLQRLFSELMSADGAWDPAGDVGFLRYKLVRLQQVRDAGARLYETVRRVRPPRSCEALHRGFLASLTYLPNQINLIQQQQVAQARGDATAASARVLLAASLDVDGKRALQLADQELAQVAAIHELAKEFIIGAETAW